MFGFFFSCRGFQPFPMALKSSCSGRNEVFAQAKVVAADDKADNFKKCRRLISFIWESVVIEN